MFKKLYFITVILFLAINLNAQIIPFTLNLDTSITKTLDSALIYVKNPTNKVVNVIQTRVTSPFFFTRVNAFSINPNDSTGLWVLFSSYQNLTYRSILIFETSSPKGGLKSSIIYGLIATAKYPDAMYLFTQGLLDENLKAALKSFTSSPYTVLGYNTARDRMFETVDDYGGDTIECIYTGRKIHAVNRTEAQNQGFNTEHTWPQSFFNSNDPMVSDLNHLFPTDEPANSARSNYPFGFVVSNITWQVGGSKLGRDSSNVIVFEPRDKHKGNCARAMFYFVIRHQNWGNFLTASQEGALRKFSLIDTVDAKERLRNDRVKQFQNNRNPFCDHPEFVERIWSFSTTANRPAKAKITASPFTVKFDTVVNVNDTTSYWLAIMNYGTADLSLGAMTFSNPVFSLISAPTSIPSNQYGYVKIKFQPNVINQSFTGDLTINNNDSTIKVNLFGVCGNPIGIVKISNEVPDKFELFQNYPNPFNPVTVISYSVGIPSGQLVVSSFTTLKIFDTQGKEIALLVNEIMKPGTYRVEFDGSEFASGIYYYQLVTQDFFETKKMILTK
jgi:hypothetical protein